MAPEQKVDSGEVDKRADIYAVGVVLYELLTLENTIGLEMPSEINPEIPKEIDGVIMRAVATKPDKRYKDVGELKDALKKVISKAEAEEEREAKEEERRLKSIKELAQERSEREEKDRIARQEQREAERGGQTYICPVTGMEFIFVKGGSFIMGDIWGDGDDDEKPVHEVEVDDFYIGKYPVTKGQWTKIMGSMLSNFINFEDNYPVEQINWDDAQEFIKKLNNKTEGKYRLPYEAEWEYAAGWAGEGKRHKWAGTSSETELLDYAVYDFKSTNLLAKVFSTVSGSTQLVGQKKPNPLGLYDMSGNVDEWCMDWYDKDYYKKSPKKNPTGPNSGDDRVMRGGSWDRRPDDLRVAARKFYKPCKPINSFGLRLVRTL